MEKDYYTILGVEKTATSDELKKAYYTLARQFHPDKNRDNADAEAMFKEIAEAYEVLSDADKRQAYDQFGTSSLSNSVREHSAFTDPLTLYNDMVADFFQSAEAAGFGIRFTSYPHRCQKLPPIEHVLEATLEELYNGGSKKVSITRRILNKHGHLVKHTKEFKVPIEPGWSAGSTVTFDNEGDQAIGCIPSDVVIIIGEKEHKHFRRDKNDLIYKDIVQLTLREVLCEQTFKIPGICDKKWTVPKKVPFDPNQELIVRDFGMPILNKPGRKGDLRIPHFCVTYPKSISKEGLAALDKYLPK